MDKAINFENFTIKSSFAEVLLGVTIDSKVSFNEHVAYICATANRKLQALLHGASYINEVIHYFPIQLLPFDLNDT